MSLTFKKLSRIGLTRCMRWHHPLGLKDWSILEWAGACAGEAGEAANAAKKLKRMERGFPTRSAKGRHYASIPAAKEHIVKEAADSIIYAFLLIQACGHDPETVVRKVFNDKSAEYKFPERI